MTLPTPEDAFDTIRKVAREHAMDPSASRCLCEHHQGVHADRWGRCRGGGGKCPCLGFKGIHWHKARLFERYGVALLVALRKEQDHDDSTAGGA